MIEGNFKDVSLPGLLQVLGTELSRNYRVRVSKSAGGVSTGGGQSGDIYVARGFVVCASFGLLEGEDAICEFLSWREGTFFVETLTANVEVKKNLKRAISASNAFVENTLYINENNVGLNTVIVASKCFGSVEWQESLRQQPLEREDFVVLGWVGEGRTMRQALREFSFDIAQATGILTRLIKTNSVQVMRATAEEVAQAPAGVPHTDPVVQRFVTTGGQEAAASSVAQAAARAYAQEATAAVAYDAFISTSFKPGSVPITPPKNEKSHGNPLFDPIKKIGLDLAQVRASMEARLRSRISRKMPEEAQSQPAPEPPARAVQPPGEPEPRLAQSGQFHLPSASGQHYLSPPSSPAHPSPVTASGAGAFGPVPNSGTGAPSGPGMRLPPPDYVSGQWIGPRIAPPSGPASPATSGTQNAVPPNVVPPNGTALPAAAENAPAAGAANPESAQDAINQIMGQGPDQWPPQSSSTSFEPNQTARQIGIPATPAPAQQQFQPTASAESAPLTAEAPLALPLPAQPPAPHSVLPQTPVQPGSNPGATAAYPLTSVPPAVPHPAEPAAPSSAAAPVSHIPAPRTTADSAPPGTPSTKAGKRERTEALPMVTIDIDRLLHATFTPTQFGKLALTNPALDQLRRQTLLDVEAGKTLNSVIAEGTRQAAAILNSYRYCLDRGYIENSDPVVSMTTELLLGRMELDQYLLQRRRLTGDQLRDLVEISRNEGVKLTQVLVRSGYLTIGDLDTLEREQKRFAFK